MEQQKYCAFISYRNQSPDDAIAKAVELAGLENYRLTYYPEKADPYEELLKMLDNTTEEEKLVLKMRDFCSKPRVMALMPEVKIQ